MLVITLELGLAKANELQKKENFLTFFASTFSNSIMFLGKSCGKAAMFSSHVLCPFDQNYSKKYLFNSCSVHLAEISSIAIWMKCFILGAWQFILAQILGA